MSNQKSKESPAVLIRRGVADVLKHWEGPQIELAVPVAFPILKVVYNVRERIPLEVGLVERYVREAVTRFGPISQKKLVDLLGLDPGLCGRILKILCDEGGVITKKPKGWVAAGDLDTPASSVTEHERAFAISGIGGCLLPVDQVQELELRQLEPTGNGMKFRTSEGIELRMNGYFTPDPGETGELSILSLVDMPLEQTQKLGLPMGMEKVLLRREDQEESFFVGATLIRLKNKFAIRPWCAPGTDLVNDAYASGDYLGRAGKGLHQDRMKKRPDLKTMQEELRDFLPYIHLRPGAESHQVLLDHEGQDLPIQEICRGGGGGWIGSMLMSGEWWHMRSGTVVSLIPAGPAVAKAIMLLAALDDLGHRFNTILKDPSAWWQTIVTKVIKHLPTTCETPQPSLQDMIKALRIISDARIQEALEELEDVLDDIGIGENASDKI